MGQVEQLKLSFRHGYTEVKILATARKRSSLIEDRNFRVAPEGWNLPTPSRSNSDQLKVDDQNYEVRIQKTPSSPAVEVTLADMGYGLAECSTSMLILLLLCSQEGSMLILEQPGVHLHPKVQSETRGSSL